MRVKDLQIKVKNEIITADQILQFTIDGEKSRIDYIELGLPGGVVKESTITCHPNQIEILYPYEVEEIRKTILGETKRTLYEGMI